MFTLQGDGDVASEGLAEVLHAAARGERITTIMLNNGVFGDTGGQMTAASVVGQRTKTSLEGREAEAHGYPVPVADLVAAPGRYGVRRPGRGDQRRLGGQDQALPESGVRGQRQRRRLSPSLRS